MIEYRDTENGTVRLYMYKGKEHYLFQLARLPECVVSKATLSGRIVNALRANSKYKTQWYDLEQCMTTTVKKGFHGNLLVKSRKFKKDDVFEHIRKDKFVWAMNLMPPTSGKERPMGSIPI